MPRLYERTVAALKPRNARYEVFDNVVPGLAIRVGASGSKSWVLLYRRRVQTDDGQQWVSSRTLARWTLGGFPAISLEDARKRARAAIVGLEQKGHDPAKRKHE